ncbi:hypothetical protein [Thermomonas sp.]|uniref:hypothetical protein n=1 Tax=Thermomonas sp. TaxID=1971895 RepID=UPI003918B973
MPAIPAAIEPCATLVEAGIDARTFFIQALMDAFALGIQPGCTLRVAVCFGMGSALIGALFNAIAFVVQPLLDAVALLVKPLFDAVTAIGRSALRQGDGTDGQQQGEEIDAT